MARIVIALGGNALQSDGEASADAQQHTARATAAKIAPLVAQGHQVIVTHGNGPQVGNIVLHEESINTAATPTMPLDSCVAMSQGLIGYWLQDALMTELSNSGNAAPVATVVTRVEVAKDDTAFANPTKPIGPFYASQKDAEQAGQERGFQIRQDAEGRWRRVVPSPLPVTILESAAIMQLVQAGVMVIAAGGGGVPVVQDGNGYRGVEAVVDKDHTAAKLAELVNADTLVILTTVESAAVNYRQPSQRQLGRVSVDELQTYVQQGQFASGSMLPKIQAAMAFAHLNTAHQSIITSPDKIIDALDGRAGTVITQ